MTPPLAAELARWRPSRPLACAILIVLACCAALACAGDDQPPAAQQQTAPTGSTAAQPDPQQAAAPPAGQQTQRAAPARPPSDPLALLIAEAAALERNGYWEQALVARESAISLMSNAAAPDEPALTALRLDRVRLLLRLERPSDAQAALAQLPQSDHADHADHARRRSLLTAQAALMLLQTDAAVEAMANYVNSDSPAWAVIALELARTLQRAGRGAEAIDWAERALGGVLPLQDRLRALHLAATELDIAGETERALDRYDELLRLSPWRDDQAAALSRTAALSLMRAGAGDLDAAQAAWSRLVRDYPEFAESSEALSLLLDAGVEIDQLTIAQIRFEEQRWAEARHALLNVLGGSDDLAEQVAGEFYIAAIHQATGDLASAALGYVAVIGRDPAHPLAAEAAMRLADFAVADGDPAAAEAYWRGVAFDHPQHERAPEAARRWAAQAVARSQWSEAAQRFRQAADGAVAVADDRGDDDLRQELLYWAALTTREAGDLETSVELAAAVLELNPVAYYGLRAADLLDRDPPPLLEITTQEWLIRLTGASASQGAPPESLREWRAARDLRLGAFDDAADRMWSALIDTLSDDPWALVDAAHALDAQGEHTASARAAARVLSHFGLDWTEAPPDLLRLAYPQPWPDVMALHAEDEGVAPLLLWSLIRRESFYDPDAEGAAGEVGLTQVIPLTGGDIAAGLGIDYQHRDLARPELSIRFGAWYLARQLEGFSEEPIMALAAYNAGPGNAARWEREAALPGPDGFLAALDFRSTRMYVQYVIETQAVYQALAAQ